MLYNFFCYKIIPCRVACRYAKYSLSPQSNPAWDFFQKSLVIHLYLRYICSAFPLSSLLSADRKKSNGIVTELRLQVAVFRFQVASLLCSQSLLNHSLAIISLRFNLGLSYFYYLCQEQIPPASRKISVPSGTFLFMGVRYTHQAITTEQQIETLKRRGLLIEQDFPYKKFGYVKDNAYFCEVE